MPLTKPCSHPDAQSDEAPRKPSERPWDKLRAHLEVCDDVSRAIPDFTAGKIDFAELIRRLEAAAEQKQGL
jgi:hypothetical protein